MVRLTSGGIETAIASLAPEVLCFLVVCKDFVVVEIALAIVAPGASQHLLDVGMPALLLRHCAAGYLGGLRALGFKCRDSSSRGVGVGHSIL